MRIGIPTEIKPKEGRVALVPAAAAEIVRGGHEVYIQSEAGVRTGYPDEAYTRVGVKLVADAAELYARAQMIVKVKEPIEQEFDLLREDHLLFSFLHLAALPELARILQDKGLTAVAWETVQEQGKLPILAPMSEIAGRLAMQIGTTLLHQHNGGRGVMIGGVPSADRGHVVVIGAGSVGINAAGVAAALGARVTVFDIRREGLIRANALGPNVTGLPAYGELIAEAVSDADLLVGAVLIPGAKAHRSVTETMVRGMKAGSVIVDVSVDQGGCVETIHPTSYEDPTYVMHDVVHFGVTNLPGAVPATSSQALSSVVAPYALRLASEGGLSDPALRGAINVAQGRIVHPAVAEALG